MKRLVLALVTAATGCLPGLTLVQQHSNASKPGLVILDFTLATNSGKPVANLDATQFSIYEDGNRIAKFEAKAGEVDAVARAAHYTLLYCTPARGGFHEVRVSAHSPDDLIGDFVYRFNADGFGPGCELGAPPEPEHPPERPAEPPPAEKKPPPPPPAVKKARPHPVTPPPPTDSPPAHAPEPASDPFAP